MEKRGEARSHDAARRTPESAVKTSDGTALPVTHFTVDPLSFSRLQDDAIFRYMHKICPQHSSTRAQNYYSHPCNFGSTLLGGTGLTASYHCATDEMRNAQLPQKVLSAL